ncbi:zinc finger and BTB domain-containing protein 39 [Meriones unguiculatus]|uniref:zinc finger and BTB domain-containing protein 39 n=1 Tax=Meriones unguiculatus TaxID=10047 RepID=UPI000B4EED01|nr:zinc finger and BTB domain-containing protein 39 [Meriones unguiculatus]XP_021513799.1 zinc finger and BTB domain-containing protein 39 [Meriones unguiculatus]XP_060226925.1 zinc finger and BTB domain-containing protein 39 [Meriones unguiculatus]
MGMRIKLQSSNHPNNLLKELNKCRLSETMCDVTIVVGSRSFPAHKAVLACAAGYFQNLFLNTGLDAARTYVVDFITPANFEKILSFVYTSELFTDLINVGVIYEVAERLGMEDLLRACHSTFPDLESTAMAKSLTSTHDSQSVTLSCPSVDPAHPFSPDRNYVLSADAGGSYKEEERNATGDTSHSLALPQLPLPPKTEDHDAPVPFTSVPSMATLPVLGTASTGIQTSTSSCQPYKVQSNGDFSKNSLFTLDNAIDSTPRTNSCQSNSDHSRDPGFGQMEDLQMEELGEDDLQFEDPAEDIGTAEEVIELSDDSEDDLTFGESDSRESKAMPCQVCKKVLEPNIQLIRQHARDHVDLLTGNCKVCETHFQDRNSRVTHVLSHIGIFLFSCDMCETKFFTQWQLTLHRRDGIFENNVIVHPNEPMSGKLALFSGAAYPELKCAACGKVLAKDFHVVRGHILEHLNLKGQACSVCDQRHLNLCSLMWHTLSHLGISVFSCSVCASSFVDWHLLEKHMAVHQSLEDALFRCHLCSQSFRSEAAYRYHVSQHKCSSGLDPRSALGLPHLALQKRKLPAAAEEFLSEELALQGQPGNSKYSCKVCGKRFAHTSEFNYHRRIHTGEKPYQCKVCHKFFRGRSTIKCHLKTHSGALMYRCTVCGHYSSTLNLMSKHVGVHKGSLPPDFTIEQTFMYIIHSKEAEKNPDS